ncbi:hypothetical protein BVG16_14110 [Paenibacillus selenitireducens]|uniref:Peptidase M56 domain-containing protein n=1 Tax=Paenibacillus selenitireducens TaxID=1324314 RepID=A0A1T2XCD6_9BACL|nr:M56 family metallopeptidase [Paenibacillus selenitireducens]OPA77577.1 hypothetical protein BVG16_14110 [Paenibacillus selenitireducens]
MSLFDMSLSAAVLIIAIVIIRALALHKLPKKTFLVLWGVVICRLLIPFSIPSGISVYTVIDLLKQAVMKSEDLAAPVKSMGIPYIGITPNPEQFIGVDRPVIPVSLFTSIWLVGMCVCALFFIVTYIKYTREFNTSLPVEKDFVVHWLGEHPMRRPVQIRQSDKITAPLTYGVFRPVVLLPKTTDWTDETSLRYVLAHEFVHIRRFDTLTKLLLVSVLSIHWFNPIVWVMYVLANRDLELSCDETVVRTYGETIKSAYAMTLIGMEEKKSRLTPFCINFSKNVIEERIVSIMKMKKTSSIGMILALALTLGIPAVFATNAVGATDNDQASISLISTKDANGSKKISFDGGKTWMDEVEYQKINPLSDIDWWTYDEYKEWLAEEKKTLPNLIGEKSGYYDKDGVLHTEVWTQEKVDETIALYEQTLEDIKNGAKVSKSVNGDISVGFTIKPSASIIVTKADSTTVEGTGVNENPNSFDSTVTYSIAFHFENGDTKEFISYHSKKELIAAVKAFCAEQVKAEKMTQQEADEILSKYKLELLIALMSHDGIINITSRQ